MIIENIPTWLAAYIPAFSLLFAGYVVEQHYVSRVSIFTNSMAVIVFVLANDVSGLLTLYAEIGVVLGILGLLSYWAEESRSEAYYAISGSLYGSIPVGALLLRPQLTSVFEMAAVPDPSTLATIIVLLMFLLNALALASDDSEIYDKARPYQVNEFISNAEFRFPGERRWYRLNQWWDEK